MEKPARRSVLATRGLSTAPKASLLREEPPPRGRKPGRANGWLVPARVPPHRSLDRSAALVRWAWEGGSPEQGAQRSLKHTPLTRGPVVPAEPDPGLAGATPPSRRPRRCTVGVPGRTRANGLRIGGVPGGKRGLGGGREAARQCGGRG